MLGKIVGFKLDSKGDIVSKIGEWSSYGVHPRDFIIVERVRVGGMCKSFLAITNRDSDNLVLVERDVATGLLLTANQRFTYAINTPTSVLLKY